MGHLYDTLYSSVDRDASFGVCSFNLTLLDTLHGVNKVSDKYPSSIIAPLFVHCHMSPPSWFALFTNLPYNWYKLTD